VRVNLDHDCYAGFPTVFGYSKMNTGPIPQIEASVLYQYIPELHYNPYPDFTKLFDGNNETSTL